MSDKYEVLRAAKSRAEVVQAAFGGVKAVLGAVDDYIHHQFITVELESWPQEHVNYHAKSLQALLCVATHLLYDMEKEQDELVHVLSGKTEGGKSAGYGTRSKQHTRKNNLRLSHMSRAISASGAKKPCARSWTASIGLRRATGQERSTDEHEAEKEA